MCWQPEQTALHPPLLRFSLCPVYNMSTGTARPTSLTSKQKLNCLHISYTGSTKPQAGTHIQLADVLSPHSDFLWRYHCVFVVCVCVCCTGSPAFNRLEWMVSGNTIMHKLLHWQSLSTGGAAEIWTIKKDFPFSLAAVTSDTSPHCI